MDEYIKGESIELEFTLKLPSGVVINLSSLNTIEIKISHIRLDTILKEGTYAGGEITYSDAATGICYFHIEDGLTALASPGIYKCIVTVEETDTDFDDNTDTGKYECNVFKLRS